MTMEEINVNSLKSIEEVDTEIAKRNEFIAKKLKIKSQLVSDMKENAKAWREQIKVISEELSFELEVRDELTTRKLVLSGSKLLGDEKEEKVVSSPAS